MISTNGNGKNLPHANLLTEQVAEKLHFVYKRGGGGEGVQFSFFGNTLNILLMKPLDQDFR